jgi:hypothetical protein
VCRDEKISTLLTMLNRSPVSTVIPVLRLGIKWPADVETSCDCAEQQLRTVGKTWFSSLVVGREPDNRRKRVTFYKISQSLGS